MMHDGEKSKGNSRETGDGEERNTVLVVPKFETNCVLIRLGESHTDAHRPKRTDTG